MQSSAHETSLGLDQAPALMRLASRLANGPDAEDLVQSTYVRALEHRGPVRARGSWLRQVLVNERRMQLRGRKRRDDREAAVVADDRAAVDVEDVVHSLEVARIVGDLLHELDDDVQAVVRQRYFEGKTAAEIARTHAIPAGTVRWRLKAGLDHLRGRLDDRYGGRRALWAGGFGAAGMPPTLSPDAASQPTIAGATSSTAGKGTSAMTIKILLGAAIAAATAGGFAFAITDDQGDDRGDGADGDDRPSTRVAGPEATTTTAQPAAVSAPKSAPPPAGAKLRATELAWRDRLSKIHAAHEVGHEGAETQDVGDDADACEHGEPCVAMCTDDGCLQRLAKEVLSLTDGCSELMDDTLADVSLTARVIGAPDVGTIVESVELGGGAEPPAELAECLTEAMYTLDLGEAESNFEQEITVLLQTEAMQGGAPLHLERFDEETRAKIEAAMAGLNDGDHAQVRVLRVGTEIPVEEE